MPFLCFFLVFVCFLLCIAGGWLSLPRPGGRRNESALLAERVCLGVFGLLTLVSAVLTAALATSNFSFLHVVLHTDRGLHIFYKLTALWAGQEGALLFWAWCAALFTLLFRHSPSYRSLNPETRCWFWTLYFVIMGFFCLLLTTWNNPFIEALPPPADGYGLNPMLQNPGMIFHPPLLFLGYGAFTVPCCLALASLLGPPARGNKKGDREAPDWVALTRPFILGAWLLLGAGIILGGWWSYRELGWGGYWAWDPVENSSLVPWLVATAYLHTGLVQSARGKLARVNAFLMALVTISAFFSTYLVRSGVVSSVHAFGESAVGLPLLTFVLLFLAFAVHVSIKAPATGDPLESPLSREGLLACTAWVFLALACVITLGTLWPVFSKLWSAKQVGLNQTFYNTVCLPLFVLLALMLAVCPWLGWKGGARKGPLAFVGLALAAVCAILAAAGFGNPLAVAGAAAAVAVLAGSVLTLTATPGILGRLPFLASHGVHLGFALMVLGVAFSGPYKVQEDMVLRPGQRAVFGEYALQLTSVGGGDSRDHAVTAPGTMPTYIYSEAVLSVHRDGQRLGELRPQLRRYASHPDKTFSEIDTLFSWGNELYCSMLGIDETGTATLQISVNPLVNWIWIGGVVLCLFPLLGHGRRARRQENHAAP